MRDIDDAQHAKDQAEADGHQEHERRIRQAIEAGENEKRGIHWGYKVRGEIGDRRAVPAPSQCIRVYLPCWNTGTSILAKSGFRVFSHSTVFCPAGVVILSASKIIMLSSTMWLKPSAFLLTPTNCASSP